MNTPRQVPKKGNFAFKLAKTRAATIYGKSDEETALIYGVTPRCVQRAVQWWKDFAGVRTKQELVHFFHAFGMGFCNEETRKDYMDKQGNWREREAA